MKTYTFTLVKLVPVVQTVTVEAEHSDDAFDQIQPDNDSWIPQPDVDFSEIGWEVQDYSPRDPLTETDEDEDEPANEHND